MAKAKPSKAGNSTVPLKHLHSRLSYLHQAAAFLATADHNKSCPTGSSSTSDPESRTTKLLSDANSQNISEAARLLTHLRGVSQKSQIRLDPTLKHTICKRCDSLLIPGRTSNALIMNPSKNGHKSWADLFEVRCNKCGTIKRFPTGMDREKDSKGKSVPQRASEINRGQEQQMPGA